MVADILPGCGVSRSVDVAERRLGYIEIEVRGEGLRLRHEGSVGNLRWEVIY